MFLNSYNQQLQSLEQQSRDLRAQQKQLKDSQEEHIQQKQLFAKIQELMEVKLKSMVGGTVNSGIRPAIDMSAGRVDRIVIGD